MQDVLLIRSNEDDLERAIAEAGASIAPMFASSSFLSNRARRARDLAPAAFSAADYPFNPRLKHTAARTLVVFDSSCTIGFLVWLARNNPGARILLWYWNPVPARLDPAAIRACPQLANVELWSYSMRDSARYGLRRNTTFYVERAFRAVAAPPGATAQVAAGREALQGAVFVGRDKGRIDVLYRLADRFEQAGCPLDLRIVPDRPRKRRLDDRYCEPVAYRSMLSLEAASEALLDYYVDPEAGLSLRAMEALRLGRKIVTNNRLITKVPYYHPDNMFAFEDDIDPAALRAFLDRPYCPPSADLVRSYELHEWLRRFFQGDAADGFSSANAEVGKTEKNLGIRRALS